MIDLFSIDGYDVDEITENSEQFLLYREEKRNIYDCYCTKCHERFDADKRKHQKQSIYPFTHKEYGLCPICGAEVMYLAMGYGRKNASFHHNFALFMSDDYNRLIIKCIRCEIYWQDQDYFQPEYDCSLISVYVLEPHSAVQYRNVWNNDKRKWEFIKSKNPHEPVFLQNLSTVEKWYTLLNDCDAIENTFLRFCMNDLPQGIDTLFISFLCKCAQHPNIEYLFKGGFFDLAWSIVEGHGPKYINWKQNDMKKMLRLSRNEILYFTDRSRAYQSYIDFRKYAFHGEIDKQGNKALKYFKLFSYSWDYLRSIMNRVGTRKSLNDVMEYVVKQAKKSGAEARASLGMYLDYIRACESLKYNFDDSVVLFPSDLYRAHDRTTEAAQMIRDKNTYMRMNLKNHELVDLRALLEFQFGDLQVIIPKDVQEIAEEGKRQSHCVASYIERHANGDLTIAFLRFKTAPDISYFTLEISSDLKIVQYRGYKNNVEHRGGKPVSKEVEEFIIAYKMHLESIRNEWNKMLKNKNKEENAA